MVWILLFLWFAFGILFGLLFGAAAKGPDTPTPNNTTGR